ncbi:MAG TPA: phosphoribosylglycinamide synthetase [Acidimicrobiaceae bacterium]|nr:phosphoribosylglycinamide synthetase [Acidimicrobiaceae bacterium]
MARVLLLVPSATYRASDFLEAARRLDVEVVVGSEEPHVLAEVMGARSLVVDLDDPVAAADAVVAHDRRYPVDAVVAVDDRGTVVAAEASRRLGLTHNPPDAVAAARDKRLLRRRLSAAEVPQPDFVELPATAGDDEVVDLVTRLGFPCVVKPATLSASQGVLRADDPAAVVSAVARVRGIAAGAGADAGLLAESFVDGPEVAVEALLVGGRLEVLAIFDKPDPLDGPAFEETLYVTPSRLDTPGRDAVVAATAAATRALGLEEGPVHAEVRVSGGRAVVIEVAARTIGGLCGRVLGFGPGRSLEEVVLSHALGVPLGELERRPGAAGVLMVPIPGAGILLGVDGREGALSVPGIQGVEITATAGSRLAPPPEGGRYLGFVFAAASTPGAVERALRAAGRHLVVRIDPSPASTEGSSGPVRARRAGSDCR